MHRMGWFGKALIIFLTLVLLMGAITACGDLDKYYPNGQEKTTPYAEPNSEKESTVLPNENSEKTNSSETNKTEQADSNEEPVISDVDAEEDPAPKTHTFEVFYLDVKQADAAVVLCDGHSLIIDGGNVVDSRLIYAFLSSHQIDHLDYIVCTHPHDDHVGGLAAALNYATADVALCPVTEYDSEAFGNFKKYLEEQGLPITVPVAGDRFSLGSAEVEILGPIARSDIVNDTSLVMRITYGETSFLFTGDAEGGEEKSLLNAGCSLQSTVLKVGHHGGSSSTTEAFLREVSPEYAVISVGEDNAYKHPSEDVLQRLRDESVKVFRTDLQGEIICISDGVSVTFSVEKNEDADTFAPPIEEPVPEPPAAVPTQETNEEPSRQTEPEKNKTTYVLNTNTHKFHYTHCSSVGQMKEKNKRIYEGTRDEVIAMGYEPCKKCNP